MRLLSLLVPAIVCLAGFGGMAEANPILTFGPASLRSMTELGPLSDQDTLTVQPGDTGIVNSLVERYGHFPGSTSVLPGGFSSAILTHDRVGGVGVSAVSFQRSSGQATAVYTIEFSNTGTSDAPWILDWTIPRIEVAVLGGESLIGPEAFISARLAIDHYHADGSPTSGATVFNYQMSLIKDSFGGGAPAYTLDISPHLQNQHGENFSSPSLFGRRYEAFSQSLNMGLLAPGDRVVLSYTMEAYGQTGDVTEVGYHALIGDPFDISSGGGFSISLAPAAVPEPATEVLVAAGLLGAVFTMKRKPKQGR